MLKKCSAIAFLLLATLVVSGCTATKTGLELGERRVMLQPQAQAALEAPAETYDDLLLRVAQQVPAFGGMFFEFTGREYTGVLYIYLLDPVQKEAAERAIMTVFGPLYPDLLPPREVRVLPAQYSFLQLKEWFDLIGVLHHMPKVTMSDIDDVKNRLTIGLLEMNAETVARVERELTQLGIPREAVILEETGPFWEEKLDIARALDENRDGFLNDPEILKAIDLWVRQEPVLGTNGLVISDVLLLELLELWRSSRQLPLAEE